MNLNKLKYMTFNDSVKSLVYSITEETISGRIQWLPKSDSKMQITVEDMNFEFLVTWKIDVNNGWVMNSGWMNIKSDKVDFTIHSYNFPEPMKQLTDYLYNHYFFKYKPSEQSIIDQMENVTKKLSIVEYRDKKLSNLFGILNDKK
jgi:hypothetical protein